MIGAAYKSKAVQAVLGPYRSPLFPTVLWSGWLDATLSVLGMTGLTVSHDVFSESGDGVANNDEVDGGTAPAGTLAFFGLFDAASGGDLIAYAPVTFDVAPTEGDPLSAAAGVLTFVLADPA